MNPTVSLLIFLLGTTQFLDSVSADECTLGGVNGYWAGYYCKAANDSKNVSDFKVFNCLTHELHAMKQRADQENCPTKITFKERACQTLVQKGLAHEHAACMASPVSDPVTPIATIHPKMPFIEGDCTPIEMTVKFTIDEDRRITAISANGDRETDLLNRSGVRKTLLKWLFNPAKSDGWIEQGVWTQKLVFDNKEFPACDSALEPVANSSEIKTVP